MTIQPTYWVDFNKSTDGHAGTLRDNFSHNDLQEFFDMLAERPAFTEQIVLKCRGRTSGYLRIHGLKGEPGNLLRFESTDPINDPGILVFNETGLGAEPINPEPEPDPLIWDLWVDFEE